MARSFQSALCSLEELSPGHRLQPEMRDTEHPPLPTDHHQEDRLRLDIAAHHREEEAMAEEGEEQKMTRTCHATHIQDRLHLRGGVEGRHRTPGHRPGLPTEDAVLQLEARRGTYHDEEDVAQATVQEAATVAAEAGADREVGQEAGLVMVAEDDRTLGLVLDFLFFLKFDTQKFSTNLER